MGKGKKRDLLELASELNVTDNKIIDLKEILTNSKIYDKPFDKEVLAEITHERI